MRLPCTTATQKERVASQWQARNACRPARGDHPNNTWYLTCHQHSQDALLARLVSLTLLIMLAIHKRLYLRLLLRKPSRQAPLSGKSATKNDYKSSTTRRKPTYLARCACVRHRVLTISALCLASFGNSSLASG